ncbi:Mpv17/PMP22 family protein [Aspergillus puulaauensis]|uniref:Protein required for ethanol metabolism n=1 Tax=Aspergillus puulaauensis TaxID=1220207 RepID=A0A7R7XAF1_9EURO|nr:protein required for ethanol metabolism [Aspergillus puulaauensis]BCS17433.1 protein required for ethanol metabolism [Aspergillus puulaauensis]
MLQWYQRCLRSSPLLTQSVTTSVLFAAGDISAQQLIEKRKPEAHEWARTCRMACYGGLVFGPAASTWYRLIASQINFRDMRKTLLARVACDQLVFAPVATGVFLSSMALLEGADPRQKLDESYSTALGTNYLVWPMAQFVNFKFVPVQHQLLFVNVVSLGWNCFLSCLNSGSKEAIQHSQVL